MQVKQKHFGKHSPIVRYLSGLELLFYAAHHCHDVLGSFKIGIAFLSFNDEDDVAAFWNLWP